MVVSELQRLDSFITNKNVVNVKKPQAKEKSAASQEPDDVGDGDWLREFKTEAGKWTGKKLVVMSLFDGIGGV